MLRRGSAGTHRTLGLQKVFKTFEYGEVAERSIAAGCKPAAFGLRRFEPSPPHQPSLADETRRRASARQADGGRQIDAVDEEIGGTERACLAEAARQRRERAAK